MKHMLGLGALKPDKIKKHKTSKHAKGHMPAGYDMKFGMKKGSPNHMTGKHNMGILG
jgi:hypothetical protein